MQAVAFAAFSNELTLVINHSLKRPRERVILS